MKKIGPNRLIAAIFIFFSSLTEISISYAITYIGASAEKTLAHWKMNLPIQDNHLRVDASSGSVFGGYGIIIDPNLYLGGEIFIDFIPIKTEEKNIDGNTYQAKAKYGYGISFVPAHYIFPFTSIFLRFGAIDTQFELTTIYRTNDMGKNRHKEESRSKLGVQYGFGLQTQIIKRLEARIEYIYSDYQTFNAFGNEIFPQNNQINLGLIFRIT